MSNESSPEPVNSTEPAKPRWYSVHEAAEYLDVGEPTLFRWMREGKITFRKVGDSTRFWREDLDSVMEVFHSKRDQENIKNVCPLCHTGKLVEGVFRTTGLNWFQPRKTRLWTLKTSNIDTSAFMCDRCGHILLFGDTRKLAALLQAKEEAKEEASGQKAEGKGQKSGEKEQE